MGDHKPRPRHAWLHLVLALAVCSALLTASLLDSGAPCAAQAGSGLVAGGEAAVRRADGLGDLVPASAVFRSFVARHRRDLEELWRWRLALLQERGIVIAAGSPKTLANCFVSLHVLRTKLRSRLPVTVMYWGRVAGDRPSSETMAFMQRHISGLRFVDASALPWPPWHRPLSGDVDSWEKADGWKFKAFCLYAAPYKHVLVLDSDAMPALDPADLFEDAVYRQKGSMFFQDTWCGDCDLFRQLNFSIGGDRQTESGMFLVDRSRHWLAVEWALWLNVNADITYQLGYGDKDTFRAAFFLSSQLRSFHQLGLPLALLLERREGGFLNRGYLQPHSNGSSMFVHRITDAKFDLESDDPKPITHVTVPSCEYYTVRGWPSQDTLLNSTHFQPRVFSPGEQSKCRFSMHSLYKSSQDCGGYDWRTAGGDERLPLFQIARGDHVGAALAAAEHSFRLLRDAVTAQPEGGLLFRLERSFEQRTSSE